MAAPPSRIGSNQPLHTGAMFRRDLRDHLIVEAFPSSRSILYSLMLHGFALWAVVTIPIGYPRFPEPAIAPPLDRALIVSPLPDIMHASLHLSAIASDDLPVRTAKADAQASARSETGIQFAGSQSIASAFPHPTNSGQTILRPDLILPPASPLISSPNLIELAAPAIPPAPPVADVQLPLPAPTDSSPLALSSPDQAGAQNLIVLGVAPAAAPPKVIPAGEALGQFSIVGPQASSSAGKTQNVMKDSEGTNTPAIGQNRKEDHQVESSASAVRIPGITIQGGESGTNSAAGRSPSKNGNAQQQLSYGLTIISTGNSGSGLGDFGVFSNEPVFTVYIDMEDSQGNALPSWILQYASTEPASSPNDLLAPPLPANKPLPFWPADLAGRYRGQIIVMSALIDEHGQFQDIRPLQSPRPELLKAVTNALAGWRFVPASIRGRAVSVKALLGVPMVFPQP